MNRVYKIVWSKAKNAYVVTSELAKNHTKNASGKMVKTALTAAVGMGVLMGGYMALMPRRRLTRPVMVRVLPSAQDHLPKRWILLLSAKMRKRPVNARWQWAIIV